LSTACKKGHVELVKLLLEKGANVEDGVSMKIKIIIMIDL
jgi:ankyrin repeat protein